ncbi:MAG: histidinol-phosphate transaminase [Propionibacteriaceae bacterium]|nr:histidinol-phosphate transaminase [Micropruina sp.]HBY22755.1 histidinol-phosphate transaminase [Propionibacteriaceae bacterium]
MKPNPNLADLPLRPELVGEEPYGAPQLDVPVCLNVNENPYPPSAAIRAEMAQAIVDVAGRVNRYPDREAAGLRGALAAYVGHGVTPAQVWAANGSNEVMTHVLGAFGGPGRTVLSFSPTYSMYPEYARNTHTTWVSVPRHPDFTLDARLILDAIAQHQPTVVLITTPNNPTGTSTPLTVIREVLAATEAMVVIDEAYQEFAHHPDQTAVTLLPEFGNLIVSRTMSKAFALAGGRVGYLVAAPSVVDACRIVRLPYHLSAQTQALAQVALAHASEMLANVDLLRGVRDDMLAQLPQLGVEVVDSDANFCLFGRFADRHDVWRRLLEQGVLVRETGPAGYLRVSAGTPEEAFAFFAALEAVLAEGVERA